MRRKVAYIMSRFPLLSETFILREMIRMEELGWDVQVYPLIVLREQTVIQPEAATWIARAHDVGAAEILISNVRMLVRRPRKVLSTFLKLVAGNLASIGFLARGLYLFPRAVWMAESMCTAEIHHIHAHYATHPALAAWVIHRLTGIPYTVTVHAHDIFVDRTMLAAKLRDAAALVAISEYNRQFLVRELGPWIGDKTRVIHCGIEPADYAASAHALCTTGRFEIVHVGSLQPYKGQATLIEACALLHRRGVQFRCRIVGGGELEARLRADIAERKLEGCVELLGPKSQREVAALLKEADCYVQPSIVTAAGKMEGIPVSLMEAIAAGVPVVATAISGVPELVHGGQTGLLVTAGSAKELADALQEVLADPQAAARRAQAAGKLVAMEFNLGRNVAALSALISRHHKEKRVAPD